MSTTLAPLFYTSTEVARKFGVAASTGNRWGREGRFGAVATPGGTWRYTWRFPAGQVDAALAGEMGATRPLRRRRPPPGRRRTSADPVREIEELLGL